jgi:ribosome biogenesis GTPase
VKGTVIKTTGSWYLVKSEKGDLLECRLKGKFRIKGIKSTNPIVVGDEVVLEKTDDSYMITKLMDRKNFIVRKSVNLSKQTHIIASNIDQAILMATLLNPITTTTFIDRFLVSANAFGVEVVLLFNKTDLYNNEDKKKHEELVEVYKKIGYKTISLSALKDDLTKVKDVMKGKVNLISGHSGVGKSTLINKLQPNLHINTKEVSESYNQGQHTTTFSELHELDFGSSIIDTPGIKGFGLVEIKKNEIANLFPEFFALKSKCKFHNCIHLNEPQCRVKDAIMKNEIAESRYFSYLGMIEEEEENYRLNDY